jgi:peptidoglycan/LPS O-acetylase OafA/YrhL
MRKTIFIAVLAVTVMVLMILLLVRTDNPINIKETFIISIQFVVVAFAIVVVFRKLKAAKQKLPTEDEMSKKILRRGAATSYYVSMYMWIGFMYFEERIELERHSLIGAGILGMALIFALSWIYHNYIRRSHD